MNKEIASLLEKRQHDLKKWIIGKVPKHYKRLSVSDEKAQELAKLGVIKLNSFFGMKPFYSQAVMAGAILSGEYDEFIIVTTSQYGKSYLMGRVALLLAYSGEPVYVAASSGDGAQIIMANVVQAIQDAAPELQNALLNKQDQLDRLATSLSKTRVSFANGGFVEAISLADTYQDSLARNKAVGRGGHFFVDEAALVSNDTFAEMGRREFARIDGKKYKMVMISNPHNPGTFYDKLTQEEPSDRTFIMWMDALTAIEEERIDEETVINSEFAKNKRQRRKYLLCELDVDGESMFEKPKLYNPPLDDDYVQYFLGIDAAYKGKDNICISLNAVTEDGMSHIEEILTITKGEWVDGETSGQILDDIERLARKYRVPLTCVDIGYGVWLVEGLNNRGIRAKGINFGGGPTKGRTKANQYAAKNASNMRAELHLDLQGLIEDNYILFSEQAWDKVKDTFPFVISERRSNGKIQVRPKSEIKAKIGRSPDELDAVLLSVHAPIVFNGEY